MIRLYQRLTSEVPPEATRGASVVCSTNLDNISLGGFVPHLQPTAAAGDSTAIGKVEQVPRAGIIVQQNVVDCCVDGFFRSI